MYSPGVGGERINVSNVLPWVVGGGRINVSNVLPWVVGEGRFNVSNVLLWGGGREEEGYLPYHPSYPGGHTTRWYIAQPMLPGWTLPLSMPVISMD